MSTYQRFAYVYDKMGSDEFSIKMYRYTQKILSRLRYRPKSIADLACGTGTAAALWAKNNIDVFGLDNSAHMLDMARKKAQKSRLKIDFSQQSLTTFSLPQQVDLATCYFDSLNYLLNLDDVAECFKAVHRALYPNGYFIFDVNTPEAMKVLWGSQVYADETDDMAWIWKNCYYPKIKQAEVRATFFVRKRKTWHRFDEIHAERGYTATEMKKTLSATGFKVVNVYDCLRFVKPDRQSMRLAVVARKTK